MAVVCGSHGSALAIGSCDQAGAGPYSCFPAWVGADPAEQYKFAKCVVDSSAWYEWLSGRTQACAVWLATFDMAVLTQGASEGWSGTTAERQRIAQNLADSADRGIAKVDQVIAEAQRTGDADLEAQAREERATLEHQRAVAFEERPADYFYFTGADAGETAADAVDAVERAGEKALSIAANAGRSVVWWVLGALLGVAAVGGIAYGVASKKRKA